MDEDISLGETTKGGATGGALSGVLNAMLAAALGPVYVVLGGGERVELTVLLAFVESALAGLLGGLVYGLMVRRMEDGVRAFLGVAAVVLVGSVIAPLVVGYDTESTVALVLMHVNAAVGVVIGAIRPWTRRW